MNAISIDAVNVPNASLTIERLPGNGTRLLIIAKFAVGAERKVFLSDARIVALKTMTIGEKIPVRQRGTLLSIELCYATNVPNTLVLVFYFRPDKKIAHGEIKLIHDGILSVSCEPFFAAVDAMKELVHPNLGRENDAI